MASKNRRKKLDLYWPTVLILSIGVLLGALFLGKYIGESFISGNNLKTARGEGNTTEIKTLSKPTIVPQTGNTSYNQKENSAIILPPSFKSETKFKQTSFSTKKTETPVTKKEKPSESAGTIIPTPTPVAVSNNKKVSEPVAEDNTSGKTSSDINNMIGTSPDQPKNEENFDRVELNEEKPEQTKSDSSYKVQAGYYVNKNNASKMADDLSTKGYDATVVQVEDEGKTYYRVQAGSFNNKENAKKLEKELEQNNYDSCVVNEKTQ
ncbi:MAG: SPOR domain-containing protein [Candidatus Eremiobacterota bacterium]